MITLHFHPQPQYYYELFHIYYTSLHCTGRYELNKLTSLPMSGFIAQLVEHRTGIAEVTGFESRWSPDFFRLLLSNSLHWKINCNDHSSLSTTLLVALKHRIYFGFKWEHSLKLMISVILITVWLTTYLSTQEKLKIDPLWEYCIV